MSDLTVNKIAFCVLGTGLLLIGVNEASHAFFHTAHHETDAYFVEVPEATVGPVEAVEEGPRDYFTLVSAGDIEAGKAVAVKCLQCHSFDAGGAALQGPPLYGVMGRDIASLASFKYSDAMSGVEGTWTYDAMDHYLENPKKHVPGTAMNFIGLRKQKDRSDILAYLRTLTPGEPLPLPAALPVEAPVDEAVVDPSAPVDPAAAPVEAAPAEVPATAPAPVQ